MLDPIIWPLKTKLYDPVFLQQRPRWTAGVPVPPAVPQLTLNRAVVAAKFPAVIHLLSIQPPTYFRISGTTRDSAGAALGGCVVDWFRTSDDARLDSTTSDANGLFEFRTAGQPPNAYYLVAYKPGSPDRAGTTINTLVGT